MAHYLVLSDAQGNDLVEVKFYGDAAAELVAGYLRDGTLHVRMDEVREVRETTVGETAVRSDRPTGQSAKRRWFHGA